MRTTCEKNVKKGGHSVTGGLKMGINMAAHTRHVFLGSAPGDRFGPIVKAGLQKLILLNELIP